MTNRSSADWRGFFGGLKAVVERVAQAPAKINSGVISGSISAAISGFSDVFPRNSISISPEIFNELKLAVRHPRSLGLLLENKSPRLTRILLGAASNFQEPFTAGMRFHVEKLAEDHVEVKMPGYWRNQGGLGRVHPGAVVSLGEFVVRLFWEYHLDLASTDIELSRVQLRLFSKPFGEMKSVFRLPIADREIILHRLRADGQANIETQALVYDVDGRLVAEVEVDCQLKRQLRLGASAPET